MPLVTLMTGLNFLTDNAEFTGSEVAELRAIEREIFER